jgi:hypothetical protein
MGQPLPITTSCYSQRLEELRSQLTLLEQQCQSGQHSEEMEAVLQHQIRSLYASLWALHAETEDD